MSGRTDIKILGPAFQEEVAHATPHEIGHESVVF